MARRGILLAALAVGGYWAYSSGRFPQLGAAVDAAKGAVSHILPQEFWGARDPAKDARAEQIKAASGGFVVPILGRDETVSVNQYEAVLRANLAIVQPWARANLQWAAAIMKVENGQLNPRAMGDGGRSYGLFQVQIGTAATCYAAGYRQLNPIAENLLTERGSVYFGTAEMDRLSKMGKGLDWTIAAYNGGAGWESQPAAYVAARRAYLQRVKAAFVSLYGGGLV